MTDEESTLKNDSVFEQIIRGEIPPGEGLVYEDSDTMAFLTIAPNNPGHTLVIPKKHSQNIFDTDEEILAALMRVAKKIAIALKESGLAQGVNIVINNGEIAEQVVFHIHIHVIPRLSTDIFHLKGWPTKAYEIDEASTVAEKIRKSLQG